MKYYPEAAAVHNHNVIGGRLTGVLNPQPELKRLVAFANATALIRPTITSHLLASIEEIAPLLFFLIAILIAIALLIFVIWAIQYLIRTKCNTKSLDRQD